MDVVLMGVPRHLVQSVANLVAADASDSSDRRPLFNGWPERALRRAYSDSKPRMRTLLEHLATHPEQEFGTSELATAINVPDWNSIAGMLGPFSRRCRSRYGKVDPPWTTRTDSDDRDHLKMPADIATVIRAEAGI